MEANDNILNLIEAWLRGELDAGKTEELERLMAEDAEFANEVNSYKEALDIMDETSWNLTDFAPQSKIAGELLEYYTDEKNKAYFNELNSISLEQQENRIRPFRKSIIGAVGIAAMIVLAIILFRDGGQSADYNSLYAEYASLEEIPTFTVRGDMEEVLSRIETEFYAGNFSEVNTIVRDHEVELGETQESLVAIYHGVAYGERGMYEEAYEILNDPELFGNSIYGQMSEWYLALILLKHEPDKKRAKEILSKMAGDKDHYKQSEASQIIDKL